MTLRFLRQVLIGILISDNPETCQGVFEKVGTSDDAKTFAERLKLFIQHCLVQSLNSDSIPDKQRALLKERIGLVEKVLNVSKRKMRF